MDPLVESAVILILAVLSALMVAALGLHLPRRSLVCAMATLLGICCLLGVYLSIRGDVSGTYAALAFFTGVLWFVCLGLGHSVGRMCCARGVGAEGDWAKGYQEIEDQRQEVEERGRVRGIMEMYWWRVSPL